MRRSILIAALILASLTTGSVEQKAISQEIVVITVDSTNLRFSPSTVTITEGDSIRFFWSGELLAHNAVADDGLFDSGEPSREVDYSFIFELGMNGTHKYVCEPHEAMGMVGTIVVEPAPPPLALEPDSTPGEDVGAKSDEDWIPFFGLELTLAVMLILVVYNFGRTQGLVETRLLVPDSEESEPSETP